MAKKALAVAATAVMGVSGLLAASPASANYTASGAYDQWTGPLSCTGHVYNGSLPSGGAGGTLFVEVKASEMRLSSTHFRTALVKTRIVAQEKTYSGAWKSVASSGIFRGHLGPARNYGAYNVARVNWGGDYSPTLHVSVVGYDDLFRAKVISRFFDDEGVLVKTLVTRQGQCQL